MVGQFSAALETPLYIEKISDSEPTLGLETSINSTDGIVKAVENSVIFQSGEKASNMGLQGWKLLFSVLSPAKWSLVLALLFTFLTVFMNVGLLTVSSWLLASAALQPGLTYLSLAIVGVRFFGVSRAVCRYF